MPAFFLCLTTKKAARGRRSSYILMSKNVSKEPMNCVSAKDEGWFVAGSAIRSLPGMLFSFRCLRGGGFLMDVAAFSKCENAGM